MVLFQCKAIRVLNDVGGAVCAGCDSDSGVIGGDDIAGGGIIVNVVLECSQATIGGGILMSALPWPFSYFATIMMTDGFGSCPVKRVRSRECYVMVREN